MTRKIRLTVAALAIGMVCSTAASAAEKIIYVYDARGRLVEVKRDVAVSTVNDYVQACYKHDKVDNRTSVRTATTTNSVQPCP